MFWVNTVFATALPLLCVFRQIKPFTEHQYGIIKRPLCIVLCGPRTTPRFLSFFPPSHMRRMRAEVWALHRLPRNDSQWDLLIPSPVGLCNPPFVMLGKSAKSKCGVSPVCVFNVPLLLSPMTRGGPPRVLALSPRVLSLLYLSTRHGRPPEDNHTCMLKKGFWFITHRENPMSSIVPQLWLSYLFLSYSIFKHIYQTVMVIFPISRWFI